MRAFRRTAHSCAPGDERREMRGLNGMIRLLLVMVALFLLLLLGGLLLPKELSVERSVVVNRPAATTHTPLNGFRTWSAWAPWAELDPGVELTVSGPVTGVGARLEWSGDPALVGTGIQEIIASEPFESVVLATELGGQGLATVTYRVEGGGVDGQLGKPRLVHTEREHGAGSDRHAGGVFCAGI